MDPTQLTADQKLSLARQYQQAGRLELAEVLGREVLAAQPESAEAFFLLGTLAAQRGRLGPARELIDRALAIQGDVAAYHCAAGELYRRMGKFDAAVAALSRAIQLDANLAEAHFHLGDTLLNQGKLDQAAAALRLAVQFQPDSALGHSTLGDALRRQGLLDQSIAEHEEALRLKGDSGELHNNLGLTLGDQGKVDQAIAAFSKAIALRPTYAAAYNNLAKALHRSGRLDEALAAYTRLMELHPNPAHVLTHMGNILRQQGRLDQAIAVQLRAVRLEPDFAQAYINLGNVLYSRGRVDQALAAYAKSLELKPDSPETLSDMGNALQSRGRLDEAISHYTRALELRPDLFQVHNNLGLALSACGRLDEAIASFRRAMEIEPNQYETYSNLVYTLHFHPDYTSQQIVAEHREWSRRFAEPLAAQIRPAENDRSPERRLRIGYVSPDLNLHPVGRFLLPLLAHHNHENFEIVCYASVRQPDGITARLKSHADRWHDILGLTDQEAAERIRGDRIDVLIDLSLHMAHNRLLLFARKPAPVQATWLGYVGTTGLAAMDYRLSDPYLDPPGEGDDLYVEKTIRLPRSFWCYEAFESTPSVNAPPALASGYITFGCFNNFCKVTRPTEELWSRLMLKIPASRLLVHSDPGMHLEQFRRRFAARGVDPGRIEFVASRKIDDYFLQYHRVDIGLDPVPYGGGTTTCDAFWMGVPVVTLAGRTAVGRAGMSLLTNLGLTQLIGHSAEEYLAIAEQLAADVPTLAQLRSTLRGQMQGTGLMDAPRFAAEIEAAYRQMWRNWCAAGEL